MAGEQLPLVLVIDSLKLKPPQCFQEYGEIILITSTLFSFLVAADLPVSGENKEITLFNQMECLAIPHKANLPRGNRPRASH